MTFLFDIGNVLLRLHFERFNQRVSGSPDPQLPTSILALKTPYETGTLTEHEFIAQSLRLLQSQLSPAALTEAWENIFSPHQPMWDLARQLHQKQHRLIIFSNTNSIHARSFPLKYPEFQLFDHLHLSHEVGAVKPDPEFYQKAIDSYQLDPSQTFYFDDLPENIATGEELGFQCYQYDLHKHHHLLPWLSARLK